MNEAFKKCSECDRMTPAHYWGQVRAHSDGWFLQKDGTVFCPEHVPAWVEAWRQRKAEGK